MSRFLLAQVQLFMVSRRFTPRVHTCLDSRDWAEWPRKFDVLTTLLTDNLLALNRERDEMKDASHTPTLD